jgi:hypothetical protein
MTYKLLYLLLILPLFVSAQERNRIVGKAVQHDTGQPIPNASVFISGSSIGTITDSAGNFELKGIPAGSFELIVSSVGYTTLVYPFTSDKLPLRVSMQLELKETELAAVTVEPYDPKGWENWKKTFLDYFLGTTPAARQCRIKNYRSLRFRYSKKTSTLRVSADEPLEIENNYLGYVIKYQLEEFTFDQIQNSIIFAGYSLFSDMTEGEKFIPEHVIKRRQQTYNGSMTHFMRALYHDSLVAEGFEVSRLAKEYKDGKLIDYYNQEVTADSLLRPGERNTKILFFNGNLNITYKKKKAEGAYLRTKIFDREKGYPSSTIFLRNGTMILIESNGYFYPPQDVVTSGYWGWSEKVSHMLPLDYIHD